jgi:heat shock protein HtpX
VNNLKTAILLSVLTALFVWVGAALGGQSGAVFAFVMAVAMNVGAYWFSDKIVLRMYGAQEVSEAQAPELYGAVADLAQRAQIPMPKVYVIPSPALNAFATGRNPQHAAVAVTEGLMRHLDRSEITGVLAHELCHVKHRDILIGTIAATLVGAISTLSNMAQWGAIFGGGHRDEEGGSNNLFVVLIVGMVSALAASLIQLAISRSREYQADAGAARLLGTPQPLISALRKLEIGAEHMPLAAGQASAHLFIVNPLRGEGFTKLFSTHPPIEERIARLQNLTGRLAA